MLRLAFGIRGDVPADQGFATSQNLASLADAAWSAGLLALPGQAEQWTTAELRRDLERGQPVVVFVSKHLLPGHPVDDGDGEQPLLLIGTTATGFVYADPSFSSSLGYGMELTDSDLEKLWDGAAHPRQALAFTARPGLVSAHIAAALAPVPITRIELPATPTPTPMPAPVVAVSVPTPAPAVTAAPTSEALPPPPAVAERVDVGREDVEGGAPWLMVFVLGGGAVGLALRRLRGGRWL